MHCKFCDHGVAADLVEVVDDDWQHSHWACADAQLCDMRSIAAQRVQFDEVVS